MKKPVSMFVAFLLIFSMASDVMARGAVGGARPAPPPISRPAPPPAVKPAPKPAPSKPASNSSTNSSKSNSSTNLRSSNYQSINGYQYNGSDIFMTALGTFFIVQTINGVEEEVELTQEQLESIGLDVEEQEKLKEEINAEQDTSDEEKSAGIGFYIVIAFIVIAIAALLLIPVLSV